MQLKLVPALLLAGLFGIAAGQVHNCTKGIALTFDDGPNVLTRKVIDALTADRHFATFFINVNNYDCAYKQEYVDTINYALLHNHTIGSHSAGHPDMNLLNEAQVDFQINKVNQYLRRTQMLLPKYFRTPYASTNDMIEANLKRRGMENILYSTDADEASTQVSELLKNIEALDHNSTDIILMHDVRERTVHEILPEVLKILKQKNLRSRGMARCRGLPKRNDAYLFFDPSKRKTRNSKWNCDDIPIGQPK